jgi:hypothetical protein
MLAAASRNFKQHVFLEAIDQRGFFVSEEKKWQIKI